MNNKRNMRIVHIVSIIGLLLFATQCRDNDNVNYEHRLALAEGLMENHPDSALCILKDIDLSSISDMYTNARYALLKSIALDKNYIDTTTFDVLQPAIDYFIISNKGNADEKLRTLYYQGRIYRNAGDDDKAMDSYLKAMDYENCITDSLSLARLLIAQATLYYKQYRINDCIGNNLKAGEIYKYLNKTSMQMKCLLRALDGAIINRDRVKSDSIIAIIQEIEASNSNVSFLSRLLRYELKFGTESEIQEILRKLSYQAAKDVNAMNLAVAFTKIGQPERGLMYLKDSKLDPDDIFDSLTYWSVKTEILEKMGENHSALDAFRNYTRLLETYHTQLFSNELLFAEKKHEMEMENMASIRKKDDAIKWMLVGVGCLVLIMVLIYYLYRMNRTGRLLAESNAEKLHLEGEKQRLLAEKLESERAQLSLEAENLHLQIDRLEEERRDLKRLLDNQETLSEEARQLIRARIEMLNGLFAQALTDQESYGKEFKKYVEKIKRDRKGFQESLVRVLAATHPGFIEELKTHGLTERELHYACLYAIGLRGKEIGNYLNITRHYNISTEIRRKLGLDPNDRNLGPYLQEKLRKQ